MTDAKAQLSDYRQSPRKVRVVADLVRGKRVEDAIVALTFVPKRSAGPIQKLLASALANAKNLSLSPENLVVKEVRVDGGATLYRRRPRSHGMSNPIRKRTSHISITLTEKAPKAKKVNPTSRKASKDKEAKAETK